MAKPEPCSRCGHIKSLHYPPSLSSHRKLYPCRLANCKCKNFIPAQPAAK